MSMSSTEGRAGAANPQAGFTLVEALVSLVVVGLFLAVLGRALAGAWGAAKTPMDVVSAVVLARDALLGAPASVFKSSTERGFVIDRSSAAAEVIVRASHLAPALVDRPTQKKDEARSTPASMRLAEPKGVSTAADAPTPELRRVVVVVRTPLGRRLRFDTVRLDHAAP